MTPRGSDAFAFERADVLRDGSDVSIVATGIMVSRALAAAETLAERGLQARVINMSTIKPLDEAAIIAAARETGAIVTIEEAAVEGGLGAAVAETVVRNAPVPMRMLGVTDSRPREQRSSCSTISASTPRASWPPLSNSKPPGKMTGPLLLAIDQGTSSTKALVVDGRGAVVARAQASVSLATPEPGWVEQDAEEIWGSVRRVVSEALDAHTAKRVVSVGLSTQREILCRLGPPQRRGAHASVVLAGPTDGTDLRLAAQKGLRGAHSPQEWFAA